MHENSFNVDVDMDSDPYVFEAILNN
jgi:hypothetical protein